MWRIGSAGCAARAQGYVKTVEKQPVGDLRRLVSSGSWQRLRKGTVGTQAG